MRPFGDALLLVMATTALAGCETARMASNIALSKNPEAALKETAKQHAESYARNPQALVQDLGTIKRDYDKLVELLTGNVRQTWGKKEVKLPTRTHYVKYTQNYQSRAEVDFDSGEITVETVDEKDPRTSLRNAIVTTLLTPDDPRAVDLFSDSAVGLTSDKPPYLLGLVVDHRGRPVTTPAEAEGFADQLLQTKAASRQVVLEAGPRNALFVKMAMVANFGNKQAEKYRAAVTRFALQYRVSPTLVYAIIKTESNFNPFAVSPAPAYGMMQLVPTSGGREAYKRAKGVDEVPTKQFLFDADNNIELGSAYLSVLTYNALEQVANPVAREYCVISAYNTGPGNVLRTFSRDRVAAVNAINGLEPPGVYDKLHKQLPYEETRQYLVKVVNARKQFVSRASER